MNNDILQFYQSREKYFSEKEQQLVRNVKWISLYRFLAFILIPFFLIYLIRFGLLVGIIPALLSLIVFLFLVKKHVFANKERKRYNILKSLAANEIKALNYKFSQFENGEEFLSTEHIYSYDLDVFGEGSLFQFLNRTSTQSGKRTLANWLLKPFLDAKTIETRQESIKELANKRDWRLSYSATGKMFDESVHQHDDVIRWSENTLPFNNYKIINVFRKIFPFITLLTFIPEILFGISYPLVICVLIQWSFVYLFWKKIKEYYSFFGQKSQLIEKYVSLLKKIEQEEFSSEWLIEQKKILATPESAVHIIGKLVRLVKEFEFRQNLLVGFILNSLFMWDVRSVCLLKKWQLQNSNKLVEWLEVIENIDALISLANFADNHPDYAYPKIDNENFAFNARELGHPLLHPEKRICSDFNINDWSKVIIITGANMAGKSTFLRSVGVNLILARTGAPVCASDLIFTPIELYTNMRTTDSLFNDESYFYAELKRLSNVLKRIRNGQKLFVILDEMLKGTNSVDKLNGSKELIRKLVQLKSVTLIATHDLKLSEMEKEFPGKVSNKCFEIKIENDEMVFDYILSDGVTKMMNATFLMKKMGII